MAARGNLRTSFPGHLDRQKYADLAIVVAGCYTRAAGHRCIRETVDEYQVAYCVEGCGAITSHGRTLAVSAGDIFINIPGHPHEYWADQTDPWTLWWVHFVGNAAPRYFDLMDCTPSEPAFSIGSRDRLVDLFREMLHELSSPARHRQVAAVARLHMILSTIGSLRRQREHSFSGRRARMAIDMDAIRAYLDSRLSSVTLTGMADAARMSIPHFERLFRERTGHSPMQFVNRHRVSLACDMLLGAPDKSIKEVSAAVGLEDQHYFSRMFRKVTGYAPAHYRQMRG